MKYSFAHPQLFQRWSTKLLKMKSLKILLNRKKELRTIGLYSVKDCVTASLSRLDSFVQWTMQIHPYECEMPLVASWNTISFLQKTLCGLWAPEIPDLPSSCLFWGSVPTFKILKNCRISFSSYIDFRRLITKIMQ